MIDKKMSLALLLATIAVAGVFASGISEENESYGPRGGRASDGDRQAQMEERHAELLEDAETYTGTFMMVDGEYPALIDSDGKTWYLMARGFASEENIPEDGAEVEIQAVVGGMSPVHLMPLEAVVDGEVLEREYPGAGGMRGGRNNKGGMGGDRSGMQQGSGGYRASDSGWN